MKNLKNIYLLVFVALLSFSACNSEEEIDELIGLWKVEKINESASIGCQNQTTYQFTETDFQSIHYDDQDNSSTNCVMTHQVNGTYFRSNNIITINANTQESIEILTLNSSTLKVKQTTGNVITNVTFEKQ